VVKILVKSSLRYSRSVDAIVRKLVKSVENHGSRGLHVQIVVARPPLSLCRRRERKSGESDRFDARSLVFIICEAQCAQPAGGAD
jgi:hypothetical protein